jgi:PPOX class probable FMN-dependent enzyme
MSTSASAAFGELVTTEEQVRAVLGEPGATLSKLIDRLDAHCLAFIARSPFVVVATVDAAGNCDASPRGGAPGWVEVVDDRRLVLPEALGNAIGDTLRNVIATGRIGLLFLIPGLGETLRVNGRAVVTRDPGILERHVTQGKRPRLAIGVEVEVAFLHCAKAFIRSGLWKPETWPGRDGMARPAQVWADHCALPDVTPESMDALLVDEYANKLY